MRYIIFSRVSTNLQDTANQLFEINQYLSRVKKDGDTVVYFDEKVNTSRKAMDDRPVLNEMLEFLNKGDTLVIYKLSRLARGYELALLHHIVTRKKKALMVSLYEKEINDEIIHAYALVGACERKNISDNTRTSLQRKIASGEKAGCTKYGFKTDETKLQTTRERAHSYGKPYLLVPDDSESKQVTLMIDWFSKGYSYGQICHELENAGFQNRKGKPVTKMTVYRVLQRLGMQRQVPTAEEFAMSQ